MTIRITTTRHTANKVNILVYSESGVGKTMLCKTAPKPLIISAEKGLLSLSDVDLPVIEVSTLAEVEEALDFALENLDTFETLCIDSISDIAEVMLAQYKREIANPLQAYGKLGDAGLELIKKFRDIPGKNIYMSAKMQRQVDEYSGMTSWRPDMPGKTLPTALPYIFDVVLPLRIGVTEEGEKYRYLQGEPDVQHTAKDRSGKLDLIEEPDLTKLFNKILNKQPKQSKQSNNSNKSNNSNNLGV